MEYPSLVTPHAWVPLPLIPLDNDVSIEHRAIMTILFQ